MLGFIYMPMYVQQEGFLLSSLAPVSRESTKNTKMRSYKLIRKLTKEETMSLYNCSSISESHFLWWAKKGPSSRVPSCVQAVAMCLSVLLGVQGLRGCCTWGPSHCAPFTWEASTWVFQWPPVVRVTGFPFSLMQSQVACPLNLISLWMMLLCLTLLHRVNRGKSTPWD